MGKPARDEEESEEIEITDFDDVLKHIGGWGPFQVRHQNELLYSNIKILSVAFYLL